MFNDNELARRSVLGFAEMVAALGRSSGGELRWLNAIGARIKAAADNPWFNAAIVPTDQTPPADDPRLPLCLWTIADEVLDRIENPEIATPCLGVSLDDPRLNLEGGTTKVEQPSLEVLGHINERAYGESGTFVPLVQTLNDERIQLHGLRERGRFVCVALTLNMANDFSIHYVATEVEYRCKGLASRLISRVLLETKTRASAAQPCKPAQTAYQSGKAWVFATLQP